MKKLYYFIGVFALIISLIFDRQISSFFTSYRTDFISSISIFFNNIPGYALFGAVFLILLVSRQKKKFIPLIISFVLYLGLTELIKVAVARPRPFVSLKNALVENVNQYKSFPSGHATAVSTLIPFFKFNNFLHYIWIIIAVTVSLSRVYLGVHYLSDVIAGFLLGSIIGEISFKMIKTKAKKQKNRHRKV